MEPMRRFSEYQPRVCAAHLTDPRYRGVIVSESDKKKGVTFLESLLKDERLSNESSNSMNKVGEADSVAAGRSDATLTTPQTVSALNDLEQTAPDAPPELGNTSGPELAPKAENEMEDFWSLPTPPQELL